MRGNLIKDFMDRNEIIEFWVTEANEAQAVARHLFEKKDYSYSLFFGHLAIEKFLKALFVQRTTEEEIPRSHNLLRLAKEAQLEISEDRQRDLVRITAFNLEARYPDYKMQFRKQCTRQFTEMEIATINEVLQWLKSISR